MVGTVLVLRGTYMAAVSRFMHQGEAPKTLWQLKHPHRASASRRILHLGGRRRP